jgi:hypothetical protein
MGTPYLQIKDTQRWHGVVAFSSNYALYGQAMGIQSAMDLAKADVRTLRMKFSVVLEKTARVLAGVSCLGLDDPDPPR